MSSILRVLGLAEESQASAGQLPVGQAVGRLGAEKARYIASFAHLLGRVAGADLVISPEESREMLRIIREESDLPEPQAKMVLELAQSRDAGEETVDSIVSQQFARMAVRDQKLSLLSCLFSVAAAEGDISHVEEQTIKQIAGEIDVTDRDYVAVRYRYLKHLSGHRGRANWP
jgi:uncharacterized tellurite resistance protein B-like protein